MASMAIADDADAPAIDVEHPVRPVGEFEAHVALAGVLAVAADEAAVPWGPAAQPGLLAQARRAAERDPDPLARSDLLLHGLQLGRTARDDHREHAHSSVHAITASSSERSRSNVPGSRVFDSALRSTIRDQRSRRIHDLVVQ